MRGELHRILEWVRANGDVAAFGRIRIMLLPLTVRERIMLDAVDATTGCSAQYIEAVREAAVKVLGKRCPL